MEPWAAWVLAGGLALLLFARPRALWARVGAWGAGAVCLVVSLWTPLAGPRNRGIELAMLDVGQGDSILLRDGARAVLVDGGGWEHGDLGGRVLLPALLAEGVRSLDAVVMTHPDQDHCGGLVDIAAYLPVREVWMGAGWEPKGCAGTLQTLPGARTRLLAQGDEARVGRWSLRVLHPAADERRGTNERSLVIRAEAFGRSALLTGDIESWAEFRLLHCCEADVYTDLLKVAHHGSKTSPTPALLDAVVDRSAEELATALALTRDAAREAQVRAPRLECGEQRVQSFLAGMQQPVEHVAEAAGDAQVGQQRLARPVHHAADDGQRHRRGDMRQPLFQRRYRINDVVTLPRAAWA